MRRKPVRCESEEDAQDQRPAESMQVEANDPEENDPPEEGSPVIEAPVSDAAVSNAMRPSTSTLSESEDVEVLPPDADSNEVAGSAQIEADVAKDQEPAVEESQSNQQFENLPNNFPGVDQSAENHGCYVSFKWFHIISKEIRDLREDISYLTNNFGKTTFSTKHFDSLIFF